MTLNDILLWVAAGGAVLACLLGLAACLRPSGGPARLDALLEGLERTERAARRHRRGPARPARRTGGVGPRPARGAGQAQDELRAGLGRDAQAARAESAESLARFAAGFGEQLQG